MKSKFNVKLIPEGNYNRVYVTHSDFKGRIKKHLGHGTTKQFENIVYNLKNELENYFKKKTVIKTGVKAFIDQYVGIHVKGNITIFVFFDEFITKKRKTKNGKTFKPLVSATLNSYMYSIEYFKEYLNESGIKPYPSIINKEMLDNFFYHLDYSHNSKVKIHRRVKAFIKFLADEKGLSICQSYRHSIFNEVYDDQDPHDDDIALTTHQVMKLTNLRQKFRNGDINLCPKTYENKGLSKIQEYQHIKKTGNLIRSLDCFLFMIATGQYYKDIMSSTLNIINTRSDRHINYRRSKTNSLCKAIPIMSNGVFCSEEIISQYGISSGSNFPLGLSQTAFSRHLKEISRLAELGFKLKNKMARKTFASILYFDKKMPIHLVQTLLGHKSVVDTRKYLRISDDILADEIRSIMGG